MKESSGGGNGKTKDRIYSVPVGREGRGGRKREGGGDSGLGLVRERVEGRGYYTHTQTHLKGGNIGFLCNAEVDAAGICANTSLGICAAVAVAL